MVIIAVPLLVLTGWLHLRRTGAFGSEVEVQMESNPYLYKAHPGWQRQVMFPTLLKIVQLLVKYSKNETLTEEEINEINELQKKLETLANGGMIGSPRNPTKSFDEKT